MTGVDPTAPPPRRFPSGILRPQQCSSGSWSRGKRPPVPGFRFLVTVGSEHASEARGDKIFDVGPDNLGPVPQADSEPRSAAALQPSAAACGVTLQAQAASRVAAASESESDGFTKPRPTSRGRRAKSRMAATASRFGQPRLPGPSPEQSHCYCAWPQRASVAAVLSVLFAYPKTRRAATQQGGSTQVPLAVSSEVLTCGSWLSQECTTPSHETENHSCQKNAVL